MRLEERMNESPVSHAPAGAVADAERALDALRADWSTQYGVVVADLAVEVWDGSQAWSVPTVAPQDAAAPGERAGDAIVSGAVSTGDRPDHSPAPGAVPTGNCPGHAFAPGAASVIRLSGTVLLPGQRLAALDAVQAAVDEPVTNNVVVLVEAEDHLGWYAPRGAVLNVRSTPDGELMTQLTPVDPPARCLARRGGGMVLELADGTVGWVAEPNATTIPSADRPTAVDRWRAEYASEPRAVEPDAWLDALSHWLGTPYLWGGTTIDGVDCSGLTQRLYSTVLGIGLPRHSHDQARRGRRTPLGALAVGDLLYLTQRDTGVSHVAVVVEDDARAVGHACRVHGQVVTETLPELLERYRFRAARCFEAGNWP
jgi:hypothetical protein